MKSICADLVLQKLSAEPSTALNKQLYDCLRDAILEGTLPPSSRLPASRDLAHEVGMSRNTVLHAYAQLQAEGYLLSRVGSGTFVADTTPDTLLRSGKPRAGGEERRADLRLAKRAQALLAHSSAIPHQWGAFMPGVPDVTEFPHKVYSRIVARLWRSPKPELLTYAHGGGHPALRASIAEHLRVARSVSCDCDQVLVTEGVHQAIDMALRMLVDPRETVWVEEPGYWGFHKMLQMSSARVRPLPVGLDVSGWPQGGSPPRLIFVTPSHQYPLGSVMSLSRRRELLEYAKASGSWIVEDDYDSEFRFAGRPIPSMQGMETDSPVIYVGTFSKTLFPGLRVGYMVLPRALSIPFRTAHADLYREGHAITQAALAELIDGGHYGAHIRRMRVIYGKRRALLESLINEKLGRRFLEPDSSNAGLHLVLRLPENCNDVAIVQELQHKGVLTRPLSGYYQRDSGKRGLILGYACVPDELIGPAFDTVLDCLHRNGIGNDPD